jgi:hypothetical protein
MFPTSAVQSLRPSVALAAAALLASPLLLAPLGAQDALPRAEVRQVMGGGSFGFSSTGRIKLDRDAFLVVFEIGADGRARVLYPVTPRTNGYTRADRPVYVPLPSADVPFIRAAELRVPTMVAFSSDLEPNLSEFTESGRRWDYQYATNSFEPLESTVRGLAELLYGSADRPFEVATRDLSPVLSSMAQRTLVSCGYNFGGAFSPGFNRFLWDLWGPVSLLETSWRLDNIYRDIQWNQWTWGGPSLSYMYGAPFFAFARATSRGLWDQFGAGCDPLARDFRYIALMPPSQQLPPGSDTATRVPLPEDRPSTRPPGTVTDVGIELATPADMARRSARVTRDGAEMARIRDAESKSPLTRETTRDLVQRQEIERTMYLLTAQRAAGWAGSVNDAFARVRAGQFDNDMSRVAARTGSTRSVTRASSSGSGSTGLGPNRGSTSGGGFSTGAGGGGGGSSVGGGAAAGSGSMSGGSEARGGGEARGGSGRPPGGE